MENSEKGHKGTVRGMWAVLGKRKNTEGWIQRRDKVGKHCKRGKRCKPVKDIKAANTVVEFQRRKRVSK